MNRCKTARGWSWIGAGGFFLAAAARAADISFPIAAGQAALMSVPLVVPGGNSVTNVFPNAPVGTFIYFWDRALQNWTFSQKSPKDWIGGSRELAPGESFVYQPDGGQYVFLSGDWPASPVTLTVTAGTNLLAHPFPNAVAWGSCSLSWMLPAGSTVRFWNMASNAWTGAAVRGEDGSWDAPASGYVLLPGEGFAVWQPPGSSNLEWQVHSSPRPATNLVRAAGPGQWDLMGAPLDRIYSSTQFGLLVTNAAVGSAAYFFDPASTNFSGGTLSVKGWPAAVSNQAVLTGQAFFLRAPATGGHAVVLSGPLPDTPAEIPVSARWTALAHPFPEDIAWSNTTLAGRLPAGSLVYFWNVARQEFDIYHKGPTAKGGWGPADRHVLRPGDGFVVRQPPGSAAFVWTQEWRDVSILERRK